MITAALGPLANLIKWTSGGRTAQLTLKAFRPELTDTKPSPPAWWLGLGLLLLTLVVYLPATQGGFIWDDDSYVQNSNTPGSLNGLYRIWFEFGATQDYYPLTFTTFWFEWWCWEVHPFGYHLVNILLHAFNAILLWRLLERLGVSGAFFAAALFAVHPVHVESVAWVTERKNVLSGLFCLLSLLAFVHYLRLDQQSEVTSRRRWGFYVLSIGAFVLAMLAKTAVIPLPLILPVMAWWKRGRVELRDLVLVAPYFLVVIPLFFVAFLGEANFGGAGVNILATEGAEWNLSLLERTLLCGRVLWFYFAKLVLPHPLTFIYPRWQIDSHVWWQYLYPLAAFAVLCVLIMLRKRIGRGPLAAALVFGLMLSPAAGYFNFYFQRYSYVADHLQYFASVAVTTLIASIATLAAIRLAVPRAWGITLAASLVVVLTLVSWRQQADYRSLESLWTNTLAKNPMAWIAQNNLASELHAQQRYEDAKQHCEEALRLEPQALEPRTTLGMVLLGLGRPKDAAQQFEHVLGIDPRFAKAHNGWGLVQAQQGHYGEAIERFQNAIALDPKLIEARNNLGIALTETGRLDEAIAQYEQIVHVRPNYAKAYNGWGVALARRGQLRDAIEKFRLSIHLTPDDIEVHDNLHRVETLLYQNTYR